MTNAELKQRREDTGLKNPGDEQRLRTDHELKQIRDMTGTTYIAEELTPLTLGNVLRK